MLRAARARGNVRRDPPEACRAAGVDLRGALTSSASHEARRRLAPRCIHAGRALCRVLRRAHRGPSPGDVDASGDVESQSRRGSPGGFAAVALGNGILSA